MAKKILKKKGAESKSEARIPEGVYFYAVGKRKTSIAQVRVYLASKSEQGIVINGREVDKYFSLERLRSVVKSP
ncbi:MAG TPA: 30S ribosomal protein S9, partial [Candidatus Moranbacteria bacterium]|nr:30S ribosomal protein S9 [Candidatus Moranbacteria bacterium]